MTIRTATPPNMIGIPEVALFKKDLFEAVIFQKGYDIIIENAIECPCKGKSGAAKTTCQNCLGLGWTFINPVATKAIISNINNPTKFKSWSPEFTGTVSVTLRDEERIALMDRITFSSRQSILSEVKPVLNTGTQKFVFCSYRVKVIRSIYIFNSDISKLTKLASSTYSIKTDNPMIIELTGVTYPADFNGVITIEYEHEISYNVVDLPHDFRSTFLLNENGQNTEHNLPIQAIARRSQLVTGVPTNYAGTNLIDNSD